MLKRWIEFSTDTENWLIDLEFLLSNYKCDWGGSCKGTNPSRPDLGCCANGAYLTDTDLVRMEEKVPLLTAWQHKTKNYIEEVTEKNRFGINVKNGELKTALQDPKNFVSGCVFANDGNYEGGGGCAFHVEAMKRGEDYHDWKPEICWQVPLAVDYAEDIDTNILHMFEWTKDDYPWFCSQDEVTWISDKPLYQSMAEDLKRLLDLYDPKAYDIVKEVCDAAFKQSSQWRGERELVRPVPVTLNVSNKYGY